MSVGRKYSLPRRKPSKRRRVSLPLEPHVVLALKRVRKAYAALNAIPLLSDVTDNVKLAMFCAAARDFYSCVVSFSYALQCSTEETSTTIKE